MDTPVETNMSAEATDRAMTDDERIERIQKGIWVPYPEANEIMTAMRAMMKAPPQVRPDSLAIIGQPNFGKSRLLDEFYDRYQPPYEPVEEPKLPLLRIDMPESPEPAAVLRELHRRMGSRYSLRDPADELTHRLKVIAEAIDIRLFIIDEVHNGFRGTLRQQHTVLNILRGLSSKTRRPLVIAGISTVDNFLRNDEQLNERFERRYLPEWGDIAYTQRFLKGYEERLRLKKPSNLSSPEMTEKLVTLSAKRLGRMAKILMPAAVNAIRTGKEVIEAKDLDDAAKRLPPIA